MRFKDLNGRLRFLNIEKRRIKWDEPSLSKFQFGVKQFLKKYWQNHICYEEMPLVGTRLRLDFYNANRKIGIECNGAQHQGLKDKEGNLKLHWFHGGSHINYWHQIRRDAKKYEWCENNGITLVDIYPDDLPLTKTFFDKINIPL